MSNTGGYGPVAGSPKSTITYDALQGYFEQTSPNTNASTFDFTKDFGLITKPQTTVAQAWALLGQKVEELNAAAGIDTSYKVLFLGRHGQGWHNVAESKYGTAQWDAHYSKLDEHDGMVFFDAQLTDKGREQARIANATWKTALQNGLPAPQSYYVSPLDRCLETCRITFQNHSLPADRPFKPVVKELVREVLGEHTCDKRRSRDYISSHYLEFQIEPGFAYEDTLWQPDHRETDEEQEQRLRRFLDETVATDQNTFISITAHSGAIRNMLKVLGHREFALETGGVIPLVVRIRCLSARS